MVFIFSIIVAFVLGTIIGSFLNVVILRWNTGASIAVDRSRCFSCGRTLRWYELIPVVSFLVQGGRCRSCGSRLSWQYPLVEMGTGVLFALVVWLFPPLSSLGALADALYFAIVSVLMVIVVYDLRHKIIPDIFSYFFAFLAMVLIMLHASVGIFDWWTLAAGPLLALPLFLLWLVSGGRWMGLGDAKLTLGIGWMLGLNAGGAALVMAFWIGAIVGIALIIVHRMRLKSEVPFAPFLIAGTLIVFFTGLTFTSLALFL